MLKLHIGTKLIAATIMTLGDYNIHQGWTIPEDQDPDEVGYLVEYQDGGKANHPDHKGYISWSPKEVFENAYQDVSEGVSFGSAIVLLKMGKKVARKGWNGKGMFAYLVNGSEFKVSREPLLSIYPEGTDIVYRQHIDLRTADGSIATWSPSGSDALADDWVLVV
jgi:hypothetical protein